ncbi:ATP-dependent Clp protease adaptor ClpS [Ancylomarina sp. 16SWW S1-10-2]|uniref:ATP-dependent Clp protease adaptor ClpS n=1 Tax=Ancylomarina sp. 16SWW S1-10-2 TaxID=2499681 RepID=UPI0012AE1877|nr:ATP-dependent Clp protease adaptor ClpS [Ancylomarina sp. 16SWW S1-10-2]MRT91861.1 ATP-dependent Clp protease adaptor ClpS [Ancylomarina sp. 16SWW S1-10-2]
MSSEHVLCLHNDSMHSFDYVVDALMEVCKHTSDQAEQCAYLTHYKGKCELKVGSIEVLLDMREKLENKGLIVSVEINKTAY